MTKHWNIKRFLVSPPGGTLGKRAGIRSLRVPLWAAFRPRSGEEGREAQQEHRTRWTLFGFIGLAVIVAFGLLAMEFATQRAIGTLERNAAAEARLHAALLRTDLEKFRPIPFVLARDPDVIAMLAGGRDPKDQSLDVKLASLSKETNVNPIYIQDSKGTIVASSNYMLPNTVVNCRCGAPQFDVQLHSQSLEYYAKGRVARTSGLYITHSIEKDGEPLGVAAVKVDFRDLEKDWQAARQVIFVSDPDGVVLISSIPEWRFDTLGRLSADARRRVVATNRFRGEALAPLPAALASTTGGAEVRLTLPGTRRPQSYLISSVPVEQSSWTVHLLTPLSATLREARIGGGVIGVLVGLLVAGVAALALRRQEQQRQAAEREIFARGELEARVSQRTQELRDANVSLSHEIEQRRQVERNLHRLQDELVQANKLATLGQIATGVAHEINQPVAAIRIYAQNTAVLIDRGDRELASSNLGIIGGLTDRIRAITDELRAFSRRATGKLGPVALSQAIEGALLLMSYRLTTSNVVLTRSGERPRLMLRAERMKLEQIFVNLLQNSFDALEGRPGGRIDILVEETPERATIHFRDNGPGLAPEISDTLFMPFSTTKEKGLGLGLVISRELARELGGDLRATPVENGAAFVLTLPKA